jgi:hypothetical protein
MCSPMPIVSVSPSMKALLGPAFAICELQNQGFAGLFRLLDRERPWGVLGEVSRRAVYVIVPSRISKTDL